MHGVPHLAPRADVGHPEPGGLHFEVFLRQDRYVAHPNIAMKNNKNAPAGRARLRANFLWIVSLSP
jgi:hypothetical protein